MDPNDQSKNPMDDQNPMGDAPAVGGGTGTPVDDTSTPVAPAEEGDGAHDEGEIAPPPPATEEPVSEEPAGNTPQDQA